MGAGRGPGEIAHLPVDQALFRQEGKGRHRLVTRLGCHGVKVNGAHVHPGGGARLEPAQVKAQPPQSAGESRGAGQPLGPALPGTFPDDDAAVQVYPAGDHRRTAGNALPRHGGNGHHPAVFRFDAVHFPLTQGQVGLGHQGLPHAVLIGLLIRLGAQGVHRGALGGVEHAGLQERIVNGAAHFPAQGVQLPHQVPLGSAADDGIAGHQGHAVHVQCE